MSRCAAASSTDFGLLARMLLSAILKSVLTQTMRSPFIASTTALSTPHSKAAILPCVALAGEASRSLISFVRSPFSSVMPICFRSPE